MEEDECGTAMWFKITVWSTLIPPPSNYKPDQIDLLDATLSKRGYILQNTSEVSPRHRAGFPGCVKGEGVARPGFRCKIYLKKGIGEWGRNLILAWCQDGEMFPALGTGPIPALFVIRLWHIDNNCILMMTLRAGKTDHIAGPRSCYRWFYGIFHHCLFHSGGFWEATNPFFHIPAQGGYIEAYSGITHDRMSKKGIKSAPIGLTLLSLVL